VITLPELPSLDDLPPLDALPDLSLEPQQDEDCDTCGPVREELRRRCAKVTTDPKAVEACSLDLARVLVEAKRSGDADGLRDRLRDVFVKYRDVPAPEPAPEPIAEIPAEVPDGGTS